MGKDNGHALFQWVPCTDTIGLRFQGATEQVRDGAYPLHIAANDGASLEVLKMLIKAEPDIMFRCNKFGETPLHVALKAQRHVETKDDVIDNESKVLLLVRCGPKATRCTDKNRNLPLHVAAMSGCSANAAKELLKFFPEAIHETNSEGYTPMDVALQYRKCSEDVVRLFSIADFEQ